MILKGIARICPRRKSKKLQNWAIQTNPRYEARVMSPKLVSQGLPWGTGLLSSVAICLSLSCSGQNTTVSADVPRRAVPIPACVMQLPVRAEAQRQFMRQLTDDQIWRVVFPSFDESAGGLPEGAATCTGEFLFNDSRLKDGAQVRRGWPFQPEPGDLVFGAGPRRTKIIWFKTHQWNDGSVGGPVAMVRAEEDFAEVYGIGVFRGSPERSRFATERIGGSVVVTATDDRCAGKSAGEACESWVRILMPWQGQLSQQASIAVERRSVLKNGESGAIGPITYRMTGTPMFEPTRIRLLEQIQAVDSSGRKLRSVELERWYDLVDGKLVERQESLWDRVVGGAGESSNVGSTTDSGAEVGANSTTKSTSPTSSSRSQL